MNKVNNNFLDDNTQYADSDAEEVIEEIEEIIEEDEAEATETASVINEAMNRIEQAKLYEALLNHQLFAAGSAKPEVIKAVRKEFKEFIQFRLEVLLGMRQDGAVGSHMTSSGSRVVSSPFDDQEVAALKDIAAKLVAKGRTQQSMPSINTMTVPTPQIQELAMPQPVQVQEAAPQHTPGVKQVTRTVRRVIKRNGVIVGESNEPQQSSPTQPKQQVMKRPPRPKTNNISTITGQDLGQAANPLRPPVPMPSQSQMDSMNANLADQNFRGQTKMSSGLGQAMNAMLKAGG